MLSQWLSKVDSSWSSFIETQRPLLEQIEVELRGLSSETEILPKSVDVLRCLSLPLSRVKVVIVGQDPYPNRQHACGLAFALGDLNQKLPKSLENIRKELLSDLSCEESSRFDLANWHEQGVLLLNRVLTVSEGKSNSHVALGWEEFTANLLRYLSTHQKVVAILWGNSAHEAEKYLKGSSIIKSAHPSPLSAYRGFFGSKPFSAANIYLFQAGVEPIDWCDALLAHE